MRKLNLNELSRVNSSYWVPFYKEKYDDEKFAMVKLLHVHNVFSPDQFICKQNGKYVDLGRKKAEAVAFLALD